MVDADLAPLIAVEDGHWLWLGPVNNNGYARKGKEYVHRMMYVLHVGPIPDGLEIDHICRVRHCVNPAHLEAVTHRENTLRGMTVAADHARRTHCPYGHRLDEGNLVLSAANRGQRNCLRCARDRHAIVQAAAASLGLSRRKYVARYGWSRDMAEKVLADA
jgi:hypothetical protein